MANEEFIDRGAQFKVYDLGDRVKKIPTTDEETKEIIRKWSPELAPKEVEDCAAGLISARERGVEGIRKLNISPKILGNPEFANDGSITQIKVVTIREKLKNLEEKDQRSLIDGYVKSIFEQWKYGISDYIYNFPINNGVTKDGEVILIDFCEITFNKEDVANDITNGKWKTAATLKSIDDSLRDYYFAEMEKLITLDSLEGYWLGLRPEINQP